MKHLPQISCHFKVFTDRLYRCVAGAKVIEAEKRGGAERLLRVEQPSQMSVLIHRKSGKESYKHTPERLLKKSKKTTSKKPF